MLDGGDLIYVFNSLKSSALRIMTNKEGTKLKADDNNYQRHLIGPQPQEDCQWGVA